MSLFRKGDRVYCVTNPQGRHATVQGPSQGPPGCADMEPWYDVHWDAAPGHPAEDAWLNESNMARVR